MTRSRSLSKTGFCWRGHELRERFRHIQGNCGIRVVTDQAGFEDRHCRITIQETQTCDLILARHVTHTELRYCGRSIRNVAVATHTQLTPPSKELPDRRAFWCFPPALFEPGRNSECHKFSFE